MKGVSRGYVTRYLIPARETRTEIKVLNSRFIATAAPVFSVEEAKAFIARVKSEFADANHNVPAYLIGHGATLTAHCHDDGEPSGTAGRSPCAGMPRAPSRATAAGFA